MSLSVTLAGIEVDDDLVLLDIAGDAYHCLPGAGGAWRDLRAGRVTGQAQALDAQLRDAGLDPNPQNAPPPASPARSFQALAPPAITPTDAWRLFRAWIDLQASYKGRPFHQVLAAARDGAQPVAGDPQDPELRRLVGVFLRAAVWLPADRKCLVRSFLLLRFLRRAGRDAQWVFGVRTWPFVAHCWLQVGDCVLDDERERLAAFTPIHVA